MREEMMREIMRSQQSDVLAAALRAQVAQALYVATCPIGMEQVGGDPGRVPRELYRDCARDCVAAADELLRALQERPAAGG